MIDAVDRVLAQRRGRRSARGLVVAIGLAAVIHGGALLALVLVPEPPPPEPLEFVAVQVVPLQALGTPTPRRSRPEPPPPEPEPVLPEPVEELPEPEPQPELVATEPEPPEPDPVEPEPRRPEPSPVATAAEPIDPAAADDGRGERAGAATGSRDGTSAFGAEIAGIDPDFRYDYYLDRMLALIHGNWVRPPVGGSVRTVLRFKVERSGELAELEVWESSGNTAFDLAGLRAVQNAAPFPVLPVSYRRDQLVVTLIVR